MVYKKTPIILMFFVLSALGTLGQHTSTDNYTGVWNNTASWLGGTIPGTNNLKADVEIYGYITLENSNLSFGGGGGDLMVHDTLIVQGNLTLGNNNNIVINNGGVLIVHGDVEAGNQVDIAGNGYFIIFGDFIKNGSWNQGSFTSDGFPSNIFIGGDITIPGGWTGESDTDGGVFDCDGEDVYEGTDCNWGNFDDILEDPIYDDLINGLCILKPIITSHPSDVVASEGSNAIFSVTSSSSPVSYRWQVKKAGEETWSNLYDDNSTYSGANTNALSVISVTSEMDGDSFRCYVRFKNGCSTRSNEATLTVAGSSVEIIDLSHSEVCQGTPVTLTFEIITPAEEFQITVGIKTNGEDRAPIALDNTTLENIEGTNKYTYTFNATWVNYGGSGPARNDHLYSVTTFIAGGVEGTIIESTAQLVVWKSPETGPQFHIPNLFDK